MVDIIRLHGDPHRQTQTLLPWYVNSRLDAEEVTTVEAHLSECAECRAELKLEQALGREIASLPLDLDVERGWAAVRGRLDNAPPRLHEAIRAKSRSFVRRPIPVGWALAAQAASLVLVIGGLWAASSLPSRRVYHTLGAAPASAAANMVVIFRPTTSERDLRGALVQNAARLVDGPTASDAYVLHVAPAGRDAALARLRSDPNVELAEPIDGDTRP
jgi:hypothetical protein